MMLAAVLFLLHRHPKAKTEPAHPPAIHKKHERYQGHCEHTVDWREEIRRRTQDPSCYPKA